MTSTVCQTKIYPKRNEHHSESRVPISSGGITGYQCFQSGMDLINILPLVFTNKRINQFTFV